MDESQFLSSIIERLKRLGFTEIRTEVPVFLGSRRARADIVIEAPNGSPFVIGEVKNMLPAKLDRFHPAVTQAFSYANVLGCKYFFVADSETMSWYEIKNRGDNTEAVEILPSEIFRDTVKKQIETQGVRPSDWATIVWRFNSILDDIHFDPHRLKRLNLFLFFLLLNKTALENDGEDHQPFRVRPSELPSKTKERLIEIGKAVGETHFPISFEEFSRLNDRAVQNIVSLFEPYELTALDLPKLYQDALVPTFVKSEELQFATRPEIVKFVLATNDFLKSRSVIDPASGVGSFLISAFQKQASKDGTKLTGIDANTLSVETVEMALRLCDARNFTIENGDFLSDSINLRDTLFDFVFCDPPLGMKDLYSNELIRSLWSLENRTSRELLFVIKIIELLKDNGIAMLLLPTAILHNSRFAGFRKRLTREVDIVASISWANAYGKINIPAHLIVIQKKSLDQRPTLFMSLADSPDNSNSFEEQVNLAIETYNHFRETGKIKKNLANSLPVVISGQYTSDLRLDYRAYDAEYRSFLDQLLNGPFEVVKLSEVADIQLTRFLSKQAEEDEAKNTLLIRASNITQNGIATELQAIAAADIPQTAYVQPGDILLANLGSSYPIALIPDNFPRAVHSNSLLRIRLKENVAINPRFLYLVLTHEVSKTQLQYLSTGATIRQITPRLLGDLLVPILPRSDQEKLISKLELLEHYQRLVLSTESELRESVSKALGWEARDETQP